MENQRLWRPSADCLSAFCVRLSGGGGWQLRLTDGVRSQEGLDLSASRLYSPLTLEEALSVVEADWDAAARRDARVELWPSSQTPG